MILERGMKVTIKELKAGKRYGILTCLDMHRRYGGKEVTVRIVRRLAGIVFMIQDKDSKGIYFSKEMINQK